MYLCFGTIHSKQLFLQLQQLLLQPLIFLYKQLLFLLTLILARFWRLFLFSAIAWLTSVFHHHVSLWCCFFPDVTPQTFSPILLNAVAKGLYSVSLPSSSFWSLSWKNLFVSFSLSFHSLIFLSTFLSLGLTRSWTSKSILRSLCWVMHSWTSKSILRSLCWVTHSWTSKVHTKKPVLGDAFLDFQVHTKKPVLGDAFLDFQVHTKKPVLGDAFLDFQVHSKKSVLGDAFFSR